MWLYAYMTVTPSTIVMEDSAKSALLTMFECILLSQFVGLATFE